MRTKIRTLSFLSALVLISTPAAAQTLVCVQPPSLTPKESACRTTAAPGTDTVMFVLQLRGADGKPLGTTPVQLSATDGTVRGQFTTDAQGYIHPVWEGPVSDRPVLITAVATHSGQTITRIYEIALRQPPAPAYISRVSPHSRHSAFAGKYLDDDIEVALRADPNTCVKSNVIVEYLSVGTAAAPEPKRVEVPALWSEIDDDEFRCAAQFRWVLSPAVGEQELRVWVKRDSTFVLPTDTVGAHRYLRPHVVHAIAHAPPAFLLGAAITESTDSGAVPKLVGIDFPLPTIADWLKHEASLEPLGLLVDRLRFFAGTEFNGDFGQNVYIGIEPVVLLIGPEAADLPVSFALGLRTGKGKDEWFGSGLINAAQVVEVVQKGLGFVVP